MFAMVNENWPMIKALKHRIFRALKLKSYDTTLTNHARFIDMFTTTPSPSSQSSWMFDCIDIYGKHFTKVKFRLYDRTTDSEITEHPIVTMLDKPNDFQNSWEFKYRNAQHLCIFGNVYWYKLRNTFGLPVQLIQLIPSRMTPSVVMNGRVSEWQYNTGDKMHTINGDDVVHIRFPDATNLTIGKPIIAHILNQLEIDALQTAYIKQFYKHGGFLGTTFGTEQSMSDIAFQRAEQQLKNKYGGGVENSFAVSLLDSGLKPLKPPFTMSDMELSSFRTMSRDEICSAFQINKFMFGMSENINRATSFEIARQFADGVIEPFMTLFDAVITESICNEYGNDYFVRHDNTSPRDQEMALAYYESGLKNGWLTPNEVRNDEQYESIDLEYMNRPVNLQKDTSTKMEPNNGK